MKYGERVGNFIDKYLERRLTQRPYAIVCKATGEIIFRGDWSEEQKEASIKAYRKAVEEEFYAQFFPQISQHLRDLAYKPTELEIAYSELRRSFWQL